MPRVTVERGERGYARFSVDGVAVALVESGGGEAWAFVADFSQGYATDRVFIGRFKYRAARRAVSAIKWMLAAYGVDELRRRAALPVGEWSTTGLGVLHRECSDALDARRERVTVAEYRVLKAARIEAMVASAQARAATVSQ